MNQTDLVDPRREVGFRAALFPLCDGAPAPDPETDDRTEQRKLEFAVVFYRINLCYDRLRPTGDGAGPRAAGMAALVEAVKARDALEDRLAPEGFYAEQEMYGVITVNLVFRHALARSRRAQPIPQESSSDFELTIPLPPPPGVTLNQHLRKHFAELLGIDCADEATLSSLASGAADRMGALEHDDDDGA